MAERRPTPRANSDLQWLRELLDEKFAAVRADVARQQGQLDTIQAHLSGRRDEMDRELSAIRTEFREDVDDVRQAVSELRDTIKTWGGAVALGALIATAIVGPAIVELLKRAVFG